MIDRHALLSDLQKLLARLEADLLQRSESDEVPEVGDTLRGEYERAKKAQRTAQNYEDWRSERITQAAAAWVLSCVFVRFLEDNRLVDPPKIAGPDKRLHQARDEWELYLAQAKHPNERDYLLDVFDELARLPGAQDVFGQHNPIRELPNWLSGDGAREMLTFFQKIDADTGALIHDFVDPEWDTRFLGDLYQDLSEAARKKYALLQTPEFVEEFILERTLEPALNEFGLTLPSPACGRGAGGEGSPTPDNSSHFRVIDPACGSGHFLLGSFRRILQRWQKKDPGAKVRDLVQRTLDSIHGVDVNPYAVAIARFRLLLTAMQAEGIRRLADAPAYTFHLAVGDSLMHGQPGGDQLSLGYREVDHAYHAEDPAVLRRLLAPGCYHAVVANPPYITPKDRALNDEYRGRYPRVCHMKYSLAVPFMQRLFDLACPAGFVGQITANSFMKREFGKKLIEQFLPTVDLTHVIDTSGAYIPGHGTPTVILFGRQRASVAGTIRAVMGIRGEPATPDDPAKGLVWSAIMAQIDRPGSQSEFVSVGDSPREAFHKHPWSIGGGGAAELKEQLDECAGRTLDKVVDSIGITSFTLEDDIFLLPRQAALRRRMRPGDFRIMVVGDTVRDWAQAECDVALFPYDSDFAPIQEDESHPSLRHLWQARCCLARNKMFGGKTKVECGLKWYEYGRLTSDKLRTSLSIVFAFVATHNHFVLDRGGKVFNRSAPVVKLPPNATEDDHLALVGLLNSSTACFWMKQIFHDKGSTVDAHGARQTTVAFENFREFTGTGLLQFPLPVGRPLALATLLDSFASQYAKLLPSALAAIGAPTRRALEMARVGARFARAQMIALQEELDWECYRLYGLIDESLVRTGNLLSGDTRAASLEKRALTSLVGLELGQRAFEIVLARRMAAREVQTTWFERHGSTPITKLPADWPEDYKRLVERRIELIETDRNIALIEQPEYKRRWNTEPWESQLERALREYLVDILECCCDCDGRMGKAVFSSSWSEDDLPPEERGTGARAAAIGLLSVARLADIARHVEEFMQVGALYRDDPAFDVERLVAELVETESVPLLPVLRYKPSGLRKRAEWEQTWELQREEDRTGKRLDIPVPPKYTSADFLKSDYWRLRGKLDVHKERWISFPHCEGPDGTLVVAWAGYDHLQLARSISAYYGDIQERLGGRDDPRLVPLLACLLELLPWLKQWHNEPDAAFDGMRMGDSFANFVTDEARQLGKTIPEINAWQPPKKAGKRTSRASR